MPPIAVFSTLALAVTAAAHQDHAIEGFTYVGCVEADPSFVSIAVAFFAPFTSQQCQQACGDASYAIVSSGCYCAASDDIEYTVVDDSECDYSCFGDEEDAGFCGGDGVWSLFKNES